MRRGNEKRQEEMRREEMRHDGGDEIDEMRQR